MQKIPSNEMWERLESINSAFGLMYFAIYSIDIESGNYLEISTLDIFREFIPSQGENQLLLDMVVEHYVSKEYQESMRAFLELSTIQERLKGQNSVSNEFFGTTQGWCRASFVVEKRAEDGHVLRFVYVTQEINAEVKTEQERVAQLKEAYASADAANQAKSDFLFRMSHDIRTPLNAIMGFDSLILRYVDQPEKVKEYANKLHVSGNLLLSLLNEILDMTKIESGTLTLANSPFSVDSLIEELEMVVRSQALLKNQAFEIFRDDTPGRFYLGDQVCIARILFNILGNAVKYTPPGGHIQLRVTQEGENKKTVLVFSVKDDGIGIAEDFQSHIFEKFQRASNEAVRRVQGTGLGLSVAKNFIELMNGSISLKSQLGKGSEFIVRIPLQPVSATDASKIETKDASSNIEESSLQGLSILVVEDNDMNMEIITGLLEIAGAKCDKAFSGIEALQKVNEHAKTPYDLIAMDVRMPDMDGYETTRRLRALDNRTLANIPVIALTANAFQEDIENAKRAGMNAHLAKPLDMNLFILTAKRLLQES